MTTLDSPERLKKLSPERRALLLKALRRDTGTAEGISRRPAAGPVPVSFAQGRLWLLDQITPGNPAYNVPFAVRLSGGLDVAALAGSLDEVERRHEVLRTVFAARSEGPVQVVAPPAGLPLPVVDLSALSDRVRDVEARQLVWEDARRSFDLARGPLARATLLRLTREEHLLLFNLHHIVTDGWSNALLISEVAELYAAAVSGAPSPLAELPVQYADFALWQRQKVSGETLERLLAWWRRQLDGAPAVLELPADHPRPGYRAHLGGVVSRYLPAALVASLDALGRTRDATLFMVLLAGFQTLLGRCAGVEDVVVGSAVAGRGRAQTERLIGLFANTLALRGDLSGDPPFAELLDRARRTTIDSWDHGALPFEKLVEELRPGREAGGNPLFQVVLVLQNAPRPTLALPGVTLAPVDIHSGVAKFDLTLSAEPEEDGGGLTLWLEHSRELFEATTATRLLEHLEILLRAAVAVPETRLSDLPLLGAAERHQLLFEWEAPAADVSSEATVHALVEARAAEAPEAPALLAAGLRLTYAELESRANRLAHHLIALGVRAETPVGIALERSADLVVALLGVLKAGGVYLPLDPGYPDERLVQMLEDADPPLVVTHTALVGRLGGFSRSRRLVAVDGESEAIAARGSDSPAVPVSPDGLAYVLYTSGSTGRPKRVAVPHRAVVRLVRGADFARLAPGEVFLQLAPISFDASTLEVWGALANGACLAVMPAGSPSLAELDGALERFGVTTLWLTAGLFHQMVDERPAALRGLRQLLAGGDVLSPPHVRRLLEAVPGCALVNGYGPTENTTFTCCHPMRGPGEVGSPVPIGRPIPGTRVYVLDAFRPVPIGVPGELCAGGDGLARGYTNLPALTAERFVPDSCSGLPGARLYRTGDRVRFLADGRVEFLGRLDRQVKVRGFRVEPEEIETVLAAHPAVRQATVVAVSDLHGDKRLAAYVVPRDGGAELAQALKAWLGERLPAWMVPALWVTFPELPLTANGKVDRRALPDPAPAAPVSRVAPRTPMEEVVAGLWAEVLGLDEVGVEDDFFELGGHSLLATRVTARVQDVFGVSLPLAFLFEEPTAAAMARQIEALRREAGVSAPIQSVRGGDLPLSFAQERLWILDRFEPGSPSYNISGSVRLRGRLDVAALRQALDHVVRRHEVLRTTFEPVGGEAVQRVAPKLRLPLPLVDLRGLEEEEERRTAVVAWSQAVADTSFDLVRGPLLRVVLVATGEGEHVLILTIHHIVSDGWSMGVLIRELATAYVALAAGRAPALPALPSQYAEYALWQRERLQGERLAELVRYWRQHLAGAPPALELPTDRPRPAIRTYRGGRLTAALPAELSHRLRALSRQRGATLFMTLLAAFKVLLGRLAGQEDVVVGVPIAGRERRDAEALIGMFLNTLVLRTDLSGAPTFAGLLAAVRGTALAAYAHQELPFEKLLDELRPERDLSRTPLFQVFFNMLNFPAVSIELPGLTVESLSPPEIPAKFDLTVYVSEPGEGIRLELVYNADLFDEARIAEMARQYETVLAQAVADPERPVDRLSLVTPAAAALLPDPRASLSDAWMGAVHERFADWARRDPGRPAVVDDRESWTYGELDERAGRLASRLRAAGVDKGDVVAIYGHRSARLVWAVLGVMKAGAAFTVLDPAHPPARLIDCLSLAAPRGWVELAAAGPVPQALTDFVAASGCRCRLTLPLPGEETDLAPRGSDPLPQVGPDDIAYVAFTSGSTGVPKGILGRHGPLSHFIPWQQRRFGLGEADRFSMLSGLSHDPLQRDMFTPLQIGGVICVPDPADIAVPGRLAEWMRRQGVTVAHLTPAMGQILTEIPPGMEAPRLDALRWAFLVGDVLTRRDVARLRELAPGLTCVNFYGSTETQRSVGYHVVGPGEDAAGWRGKESLPLGRGVEDVQLLVVHRAGGLAGVGELGEIYVRGHHLAHGYLSDPAGTAAKFLDNPFGGRPGDRVYRTGDLGRYLPDGEVEFAGRVDFQVKIRGFRIEPGEIEALLARHPAVRDCAVLARDAAAGERRLVAYVAPERPGVTVSELRTYTKERLPDYMVPSAFVLLEKLPVTPNGKLDRRALPDPAEERAQDGTYVAPRNETERRIAEVLREVLAVDKVGLHDNFFELGGSSLQLVRVHSRLREIFTREMQVFELFTHPTVAALADFLSDGEAPAVAARELDRTEELQVGKDRRRMRFEKMRQRS